MNQRSPHGLRLALRHVSERERYAAALERPMPRVSLLRRLFIACWRWC